MASLKMFTAPEEGEKERAVNVGGGVPADPSDRPLNQRTRLQFQFGVSTIEIRGVRVQHHWIWRIVPTLYADLGGAFPIEPLVRPLI